MGERIQGHWRILAATLFSAVLIVGTYLIVRGVETPTIAQASTEAALLQAIAAKDSDGDGLPDWEERLYGTDPRVVDTSNLGMTDGEAVAKGLIVPKAIADIVVATSSAGSIVGLTVPAEGTLTDAFAKKFFTLYLSAKEKNGSADLSGDQISALADQAVQQLTENYTPSPDFKTAADITVTGSGPDAFRAFAAAAEAIIKKNATASTMSELGYLQAAIQEDDASALSHLVALADAYRATAVGLAVLPVPKELVAVDVELINGLMRLSQMDNDFARVNADPLTAILALQQYPQTELKTEHAFANLYKIYADNGVVLQNGTPGAAFVNLIYNLGAVQQQERTQTP